jgi:hypothetical protein
MALRFDLEGVRRKGIDQLLEFQLLKKLVDTKIMIGRLELSSCQNYY